MVLRIVLVYNILTMKPILKWVGGKTQILDKVLDNFPSTIDNYYEPFIGGGSVLLGLLSSDNILVTGNIYANDSNPALINMYKNIQSDPEGLYNKIEELSKIINGLPDVKGVTKPSNEDALQSRESYYYWMRSKYNKLEDKSSLESSSMFIFLNKTCFRGLHREGPNGFNVPWGNYKNPIIASKSHLMEIHNLIRNVIFTNFDWSGSIANVCEGDFVYLDPPYVPVDEKSFVAYTKAGFVKHDELFERIKGLSCKWLMSNSSSEIVSNAFTNNRIIYITCKRSINSKNPESTCQEVLVPSH